MTKWYALAALVAGLQTSMTYADVQVKNAWLREPPPGRDVSAVFLELKNNGDTTEILTSANADWAETIEIHTHENANGTVTMRELEEVVIEPDQTQYFKPRGLHLMVMGINDTVPENPVITLCFQSGECQIVELSVRGPGDKPKDKPHHDKSAKDKADKPIKEKVHKSSEHASH